MDYLLDANAVIAILDDQESRPAQRLRRLSPAQVYLSAIVTHELFYGAFKSQRSQSNVALVDNLRFQVLEFDKEDSRMAGKVRASLALAGTPIGPYDVLIAGQALARDLTLVTNNTAEFRRVPGLRLEDWSAA